MFVGKTKGLWREHCKLCVGSSYPNRMKELIVTPLFWAQGQGAERLILSITVSEWKMKPSLLPARLRTSQNKATFPNTYLTGFRRQPTGHVTNNTAGPVPPLSTPLLLICFSQLREEHMLSAKAKTYSSLMNLGL